MATLKDKNVVTRKPHRCLLCMRILPAGSSMRYWVGIYEGDFCTSYSCQTCIQIIDLEQITEYEEGDVKEMLYEHQTPEDLLCRLKMNRT